jgi:hypothetical protein
VSAPPRPFDPIQELAMKDVAVVSYCRTGIARAVRGALNRTHGISSPASRPRK